MDAFYGTETGGAIQGIDEEDAISAVEFGHIVRNHVAGVTHALHDGRRDLHALTGSEVAGEMNEHDRAVGAVEGREWLAVRVTRACIANQLWPKLLAQVLGWKIIILPIQVAPAAFLAYVFDLARAVASPLGTWDRASFPDTYLSIFAFLSTEAVPMTARIVIGTARVGTGIAGTTSGHHQ